MLRDNLLGGCEYKGASYIRAYRCLRNGVSLTGRGNSCFSLSKPTLSLECCLAF